MPELPEVETVKESLQPYLIGQKIIKTKVHVGKLIKHPSENLFVEKIAGRTIVKIARRGKYLLFHLDQNLTLVIHLRMTGQLLFFTKKAEYSRHTHLVFHFDSQRELRFIDVRKFGLIYLVPTGNWEAIQGLKQLGVEPLSPDFTLDLFRELLAGRKGMLKPFLLNQKEIAGIGNLYADEILFRSGLHPKRKINTLDTEEIKELYGAIINTLKQAVLCRGTSFQNYVDGCGELGGFQAHLQVYGRGGKPCIYCQIPLQKIKVAGRGTVFCPCCQKAGDQERG